MPAFPYRPIGKRYFIDTIFAGRVNQVLSILQK